MRAILFVTVAVALTAGAIAQAVAPAAQAGPSITETPALNHATIVSISGSTPDATLYYTTDGATPTAQLHAISRALPRRLRSHGSRLSPSPTASPAPSARKSSPP